MMMRHLASVGETYAQTAFEDTAWNLWPINPSQASASGSTIPSTGGRLPGGTGSLHIRTPSRSASDNTANLLAMADTVREVLPHIPDDIIFQVSFGSFALYNVPWSKIVSIFCNKIHTFLTSLWPAFMFQVSYKSIFHVYSIRSHRCCSRETLTYCLPFVYPHIYSSMRRISLLCYKPINFA